MPNNHAFATGLTFKSNFSFFERLLVYLLKPLRRIINFLRYIEVKVAFNKSAILGEDVKFGVKAWCYSESDIEKIQIGDRTVCRGLLRLENWSNGRINIGKDVYIGDDCLISSALEVNIGNSAMLAHGVQVFDNNTHPIDAEARVLDYMIIRGLKINDKNKNIGDDIKVSKVFIGQRVWIGFNSIIMRGVHIGDDSIIAPGSIVTHDVPSRSIFGGNPARLIRKL